MTTKRRGKKKIVTNVSYDKNTHQTNDCRIIEDKEVMINKTFSLSICLKPHDDVPHPRHLCFAYPFGKTSPKKHCIKCYCFVCEKIAPCKNWKKTRHCDATEKDDKWIIEKQLNNKLRGSTTMLSHKLTVAAIYPLFEQPDTELFVRGGGLICDDDGNWVIGISTELCLCSIFNTGDISAPCYIALLKALRLAWMKGFRCLEVKLGFVFHDKFWSDFTRDSVTKIFRLCVKQQHGRALVILNAVKDCLNREWFITVKETKSYEEECGALIVTSMADHQWQNTEIFDFSRSQPFDTETVTRECMSIIREIANDTVDDETLSAEQKKYLGLD